MKVVVEYAVMDYEKVSKKYLDREADLVILDPPFGIRFNGKSNNYNRDNSLVVDGYHEWSEKDYRKNILGILTKASFIMNPHGNLLLFSGWNNVKTIYSTISGFYIKQKLYFITNFAPPCKHRPAHNVYEIFWLSMLKKTYYNNRCSTSHCEDGVEKNLCVFNFKKEYNTRKIKYPTKLPTNLLVSLIEHFSPNDAFIVDFLAGSGTTGIASLLTGRDAFLSDVNPNGLKVFLEYVKTLPFEVEIEKYDNRAIIYKK